MKFGITLGVLAVLVIGGIAIAARGNPTTPANQQSTNQQVLSATAKQLETGTQVYDVRTPEEYATSHVKSATLLPLADIQSGKLPDVPMDTPIALYCRSGNRSKQATKLLQEAGYAKVTDLGGLNSLTDFGLKAE